MPKKLCQSQSSKERAEYLAHFLLLLLLSFSLHSAISTIARLHQPAAQISGNAASLLSLPVPSSQQPNVLALALSPLSSSLYSKMSTSRDHTCNTLELTTPLNPLGKPILVPLTTSLYVPGELADTENVIVDIGTGFYVEKVRLLFSSIILYLPFITPLHFSNSILYIHFFIPILEITCILNSLETYIQTLEHQRCNQILRSKS